MAQFRAFVVRLPSGERYWTVIDERYRPVPEADDFLLHLRLGRDCAESTTEAYARSVALFLQWCSRTGLGWGAAGAHLGRFMLWLGHYDPKGPDGVVGAEPVRQARRVNQVLAAVREFLKHAAAVGAIDQAALDPLFEVVEDWDLPLEVRGERAPRLRVKPRHRLDEPEREVQAASDEEVLGLVRACRNARDRFIVIGMWRAGLRRVHRSFIHRHPDLRAAVLRAADGDAPPDVPSNTVSRRSLLADNANLREQNRRLAQQLGALEERLSDLLGAEAFQRSGLGAQADTAALQTQVAQLQQRVLDLERTLEEREEELAAAREAHRRLMAEHNRATARTQ